MSAEEDAEEEEEREETEKKELSANDDRDGNDDKTLAARKHGILRSFSMLALPRQMPVISFFFDTGRFEATTCFIDRKQKGKKAPGNTGGTASCGSLPREKEKRNAAVALSKRIADRPRAPPSTCAQFLSYCLSIQADTSISRTITQSCKILTLIPSLAASLMRSSTNSPLSASQGGATISSFSTLYEP